MDTTEREDSLAANRPTASPRAWALVGGSIAALLLAVVVAGVIAIVGNVRVKEITERALRFDIEVEDKGDDLRAAVLDLRHVHRNFVFSGASETALTDFDEAYAALQEEIAELESLDISGLDVPQPERIRELAARYYGEFRPAAERANEDPGAFQIASSVGLTRLAAMDDAASEIDELGERLAEESLLRIEQATRTEQLILSGLILGALAVGITLAVTSSRILARLRTLYESEQRSRRELARALHTKTDFVADASHELRTPLAVILGNAETALANDDAATQRTSLATVAAEARRMGRLVDDLLFLARSDSGAPPLDKEYVPARWLLSRLMKPAEMLTRQSGAFLSETVQAEGYLDVDPGRIEQAVLILIDNAARHSPAGRCVELAARIEAGQLAVDVADHGPGVPAEELPFIFDRFYQVRNRRNRKKGGSGLGLSIAHTIVAAHGGTIAAASEPGAGTRMTIRLPLAAPPDVLATIEAPVSGSMNGLPSAAAGKRPEPRTAVRGSGSAARRHP